ncbi:UTRA domain-containing protein [Pseudodesulfovibrio sp. zrk46]|uniref:UTRA domain-containing protein n=1 Tax=Pseudodesulfovibrio sp. zrk46 TaxID=2725288 RepID=UPI0014499BBC|nr:UTRA domain-containing protein [Pseudodesulfovibrio sp. zrk46]QJB56280.1 UTRA domain-containing protein [Pseudodesulfovibrio sp. zrk46]
MAKQNKSLQIRDFILTRIRNGAWITGQKIPSEAELMSLFSASRMTVHRAVKELAAEGHLLRERGRGTFVAKRIPRSELLTVRDIVVEIKERGGTYYNEVKHVGYANQSARLSHVFGGVPIASIAHSIIVHYENGEPLQLENRWVDLNMVPGYLTVDFTTCSPSRYLSQEAPLQKAEHELTAALPNQEQQNFLEIRAGDPCLLLKRKTWSGDRLVSYAELLYPASRYSFGGVFTPGT